MELLKRQVFMETGFASNARADLKMQRIANMQHKQNGVSSGMTGKLKIINGLRADRLGKFTPVLLMSQDRYGKLIKSNFLLKFFINYKN